MSDRSALLLLALVLVMTAPAQLAAQSVEDPPLRAMPWPLAEPSADPQSLTHAWKLSGDSHLRPVSVRDDGAKTFIVWAEDQAIPAVFAVVRGGSEQVVDGYMREGAFIIDSVHPRLVFRIDRHSAFATRQGRRR